MDCSLTGFSVHGIYQARILEWVAISFSCGSSHPRDGIPVSCIAGGFFTELPRKHHCTFFEFNTYIMMCIPHSRIIEISLTLLVFVY